MSNRYTLAILGLTLSIDRQAQVLDDLHGVFLYLSANTKDGTKIIATVSPIPIMNSVGL